MAHRRGDRTKEVPFMFDKGWDLRGSGVGEDVGIVDLQNAWLSRHDLGAVESMPGDREFIDFTTYTTQYIVSMGAGMNQSGRAGVPSGTIGVVAQAKYGEVLYAKFNVDSDDVGELRAAYSGTDEWYEEWPIAGIIKLKDAFHLFPGAPSDVRKGQITVIGSNVIDDIGVPRPDESDIYTTFSTTSTYTTVKGSVRYWVSAIEDGKESALSDQIPREGSIVNKLGFYGTEYVTFGDNYDFDLTADFSVELLLRMDKKPSSAYFVYGKRNGIAIADAGWAIHVGSLGKLNFAVSDGTNVKTVTTDDDVCDGLYHRYTVVFDQAADDLELYRDGVSQQVATSVAATVSGTTTNSWDLTLGANKNGTQGLRGYVADVRQFDTALASGNEGPGDGEMHRQVATPGSRANLVGYWYCDEGTGATLEDEIGAVDGTLVTDLEPEWITDESYADAIDCGDGDSIDIIFNSSKYYGKKYRIYRSNRDGSTPFYLATFSPASGAGNAIYTDDISDEDLGDLPDVHGDEPPSKARPAVVHANRIYVASGKRVYWTDSTHEESYFTQANGNWIDVYPDDGDEITALSSDYDSIIIFKSNHIYRLSGRKPDEFSLRPMVPSTAIPVAIGTPSAMSLCSTPEGVVFYWDRKVYILRNGYIQRISDPVGEYFDDLDLSVSIADVGTGTRSTYNSEHTGTVLGYWAKRNQVWVSVGGAPHHVYPNATLIYDLTSSTWIGQRSQGYFAMQSVRHALPWVYDDAENFDEELFIAGSADKAGFAVEVVDEFATTFFNNSTGEQYESHVELGPFWGQGAGGNLNNLKKFLWVDIIFEPKSTGDKFDVIWWTDAQYGVIKQPSGRNPPSPPTYYDLATTVEVSTDPADLGITTKQSRYVSRVNINEVGKELSLKIHNTPDTDGHFKVFGVVYGYQDHPSVSR